MTEGDDSATTQDAEAPNERRLSWDYDDWKDALREFFRRQDEDVRPEKGEEKNGSE